MAYRIDLTPNASYTETVSVSQDDVGREIVVDLYKDGTAYTPTTGTTITMQGTKPSGLGYTITGTASGSTVTFLTTEEMTQEAGRFASEIVLTNGDTVIGTANFALYVEKNPHPENSTDGTLETIPALTTRTEALEQAVSENTTDITNVENAIAMLDAGSLSALGSALGNTPVSKGDGTWAWMPSGYVTPEMYGAVGDGVTDDSEAVQSAFDSNCGTVFLKKDATYLVANLKIQNIEDLNVIGYGATIKVNKEFEFVPFLQMVCLLIENSKNIKIEGVTFDASWKEIKELHNFDVDTTLENYCVRLLGGNDGVAFLRCTFGNQLKVCIQTKGSYLGGDVTDPSSVDSSFVPNKNIDIGYCVFGWNYEAGLHNGAIQFLDLPQVATDINAHIHDNLMLMSGEHGIHIYHGNNSVTIENNTILNSGHGVLEDYYLQGGTIVKGYGIEFTSCNKITIRNNYVRNFIAGGIYVTTDAWHTDGDIYDVTISENTVVQDADYSQEFFGYGIALAYCYRAVISSNIVRDIRQAKNNGSECWGIQASHSEQIIICNNIVEACQNGLSIQHGSLGDMHDNFVTSLTNAFGNSQSIKFYNVSNVVCSGNTIDRGTSEITNLDGIYLGIVTDAVVSSNNIKGTQRGFGDGANTINNVAVFGNIFSGVTAKYVWWGKHTGLVVDFVAVADN